MALNRDQLLSLSRRRKEVAIEGGSVFIRELSADEVSDYLKRYAGKDGVEAGAWLVTKATCDENGNAVFSDADFDSVRAMGFAAIKPIGSAIAKFSGLDMTEADQKKD